jgi:hypothetical protein
MGPANTRSDARTNHALPDSVIPAQAGIQCTTFDGPDAAPWIPAFAGMTIARVGAQDAGHQSMGPANTCSDAGTNHALPDSVIPAQAGTQCTAFDGPDAGPGFRLSPE